MEMPGSKTDVIVHYGSKEGPYAELFFSLCSILNNESAAAVFNRGIRANKFDANNTKGNEPQFSNRQYELYIGEDKNMTGLEQIFSSYGLHICMMGRKACIFVDGEHTDREQYREFRKFAEPYEKKVKELCERVGDTSMVAFGAVTMDALADSGAQEDGFIDIPMFLKKAGHFIAWPFAKAWKGLGFGRQKVIREEKFMFLVKLFYASYFPSFVNEPGADEGKCV